MTNLEPDPLEQLLDEQSDSEFGLPAFKEQKQVLANWSAQDFSDIYVRFYPHLLRHAKRYLTNHSQAEEVVQDAFLYLMTSLPEIDSEIGVLKLLKWKVRNLALDVISANGKASFAPVDDVDLPVEHELSENLIRADEASIVSLALAKLNPRQREALIASLYEEKETAQIANQMGLSENATRQLLFRAKSAFKKALVGEAETVGMSVSQILSIAARKAAQDSGKYIGVASALLLVLAVSVGILPNLPRQAETSVSAPVVELEPETLEKTPEQAGEIEVVAQSKPVVATSISAVDSDLEPAPTLGNLVTSDLSLGSNQAGFAYVFGADKDQLVRELLIYPDEILSAQVDLARVEETYSYVLARPRAQIMIEGKLLNVAIGAFASSQALSERGQTLTLVGSDLSLENEFGKPFDQQPLAESSLTMLVELDTNGQVIGASIFLN